ncbi:hypothetical protein [Streptomyces sp. NPDC086787]|uniref:hypothetical protein n=1 Tax=Streptomyces sp. NPDC086787 TaxID=3365759 RepID=UPI003808DCDD
MVSQKPAPGTGGTEVDNRGRAITYGVWTLGDIPAGRTVVLRGEPALHDKQHAKDDAARTVRAQAFLRNRLTDPRHRNNFATLVVPAKGGKW